MFPESTLRRIRPNCWLPLLILLPVSHLGFAAGKLAVDVAAIDRERILAAAASALKVEPITITKFRAKLSEGGAHDFYSNGDYWWPNPNTTNGLPYVQRDGQTNPENFVAHRKCISELRNGVAALAAAYKISGDDRYVIKAAELLRVFFLDPATRMNPSLKYAQAIPGVTPGRGIGIIDTLHLIEVPKAIRTLDIYIGAIPFVLIQLAMVALILFEGRYLDCGG